MKVIKNITPEQARGLISKNENNKNFVILDVRTLEEYEEGHIEKAVLMDVYQDDFKDGLDKLDRNKEYLVYCRTGARSYFVLGLMDEMGFKKVYNMLHGIVSYSL